jgi:hypothetical protein
MSILVSYFLRNTALAPPTRPRSGIALQKHTALAKFICGQHLKRNFFDPVLEGGGEMVVWDAVLEGGSGGEMAFCDAVLESDGGSGGEMVVWDAVLDRGSRGEMVVCDAVLEGEGGREGKTGSESRAAHTEGRRFTIE